MLNSFNIKKIVYGSFGVFLTLYFLSAALQPLDPETLMKYNLSELQLRLLTSSLLIPVAFIWGCATYGFVHFKQYALSIKGSPFGKGINTVANGLGIIVAQLLISGGLSVATSLKPIEDAFGGEKGVEIISADLTIIFTVAAALTLYQGALQLNASFPRPSRPKAFTKSFYILVIVSVAFLLSIALRYPTTGSTDSIYEHIPLGAAIIGVGVPYIIAWNFFLLAGRNLHHYRQRIKGKVYKQAIGFLAMGLYLILGSSVFIQVLGAFSDVLSDLKLLPLLVLVYALIAAIGVGYLFIARAATLLRKVEL